MHSREQEKPSRDILGASRPRQVVLTEVGPRDGFQFESRVIPTDLKAGIVRDLVGAGLRRIQVTSFVHPGKVPQMADAEDLIRRLPTVEGVRYSGLALNLRGVERAHGAGLGWVEVSASASDTHSRKNAGMSHERAAAQATEMIGFARSHGMGVTASVQCAFGCAYEGTVPPERVAGMVEGYLSEGADGISLADTTGMGTPASVARLLHAVLPLTGAIPVGLHLHDTRGLGLCNLTAALAYGVDRFDTALGGMGGCPFVPQAAGNIPTEDTAHLLASLGIETGVDIPRVAAVTRRLARFLGKSFSGRVWRLSAEP